uniref:Tyrosine-protein kinase n=1 Tax=Caenorhabditis japonica TaxID=281687 RepID=A0A8R1DJF9_CAEJA
MESRELSNKNAEFVPSVYLAPTSPPKSQSNKNKIKKIKKKENSDKTTDKTENSITDLSTEGDTISTGMKKKRRKKRKKRRRSLHRSKSVTEEKGENKPEKEDFEMFEKKLRDLDFYHGFLPREDLQSTLQNPGDYLLRVSEVHEGEGKVKRELILSLIPIDGKEEDDKKKCRNVVIKRVSSNMFFCETSRTFETINELLAYYKKNSGTCSTATFQLKNPILIQPWEFMHSDVTIGKVLGEGAFGKVCAGTLKLKDGERVEVAIKMTKVSAFLSKMKIKEMMNEARFIRNFNHKNVVRLYGVAHDKQPLYILLELVKGGSLQDYLKECKAKGNALSNQDKIKLCAGAARGIEYLHNNNCIHRDIAARNCLLSDKDKSREVKITDFGLSRSGPSYRMKTSCKLPVKWLAPETISTFTFSYATDVYSWGITCYEVFADGLEPFDQITNAQCKTEIAAGKFLQMPANAPDAIKKYISEMIFVEASRRATMLEAAVEFEKFSGIQKEQETGREAMSQRALSVHKDVTSSNMIPPDVKASKFYHGAVPRVDAEESLRAPGDFLLRKAESKDGVVLVISVRKEPTGFTHIPLNVEKDLKTYYFDISVKDTSVIEVINAHLSRNVPISTRSGVLIRKPVFRSTWILRHEDVIINKKIGSGAFGEVFLARMVDPTSEYLLDCAVKTMKQEASTDAKLRFHKEARMMRKNYKHNHVVMIFGVATLNSPLLIVMELCPNGSLISYLRKNKGKVSLLEKLRFIYETASGLSHLEKMNCVHRDVAARNCLLSAKNAIKISDFGLADDRRLVIDTFLDKLPIKWLAPEIMQEKMYSLKSDIWAYGITVWEIFADGDEPYPGLSNVQARAKIVAQDYRMKLPAEAPPEIVQIVETCWDKNPDKRKTMTVHSNALQIYYEARAPPPFPITPVTANASTSPGSTPGTPLLSSTPPTPCLPMSTDMQGNQPY